jgi:hypothetical protein
MTSRFTRSAFALCMVGAFAVGSPATAAVYDLYDDFSTSGSTATNLGPDGVWSFLAMPGTPSATPFNGVQDPYWMDDTSPAWYFPARGSDSVPAISAITNPNGAANANWDLDQGDVGLHQLGNTGLVDIVWTAPQATTVDLTGLVWGADLTGASANRPQEITLSHLNSSGTLISTLIGTTGFETDGGRGSGVSLDYSGLAVSSGDRLLMRVQRTGAGDTFGGLVGVQFAVVPEPGSLVLLAGAGAALCWRRRRCRQPMCLSA